MKYKAKRFINYTAIGIINIVIILFRWILIMMYAFGLMASGFCMIGFSAIAPIVAHIFNVSIIEVNMLMIVFLIAFPPTNFLAIYVLESYGLRTCLIMGAILHLSGAWLRHIISADTFGLIFVGQVLLAVG